MPFLLGPRRRHPDPSEASLAIVYPTEHCPPHAAPRSSLGHVGAHPRCANLPMFPSAPLTSFAALRHPHTRPVQSPPPLHAREAVAAFRMPDQRGRPSRCRMPPPSLSIASIPLLATHVVPRALFPSCPGHAVAGVGDPSFPLLSAGLSITARLSGHLPPSPVVHASSFAGCTRPLSASSPLEPSAVRICSRALALNDFGRFLLLFSFNDFGPPRNLRRDHHSSGSPLIVVLTSDSIAEVKSCVLTSVAPRSPRPFLRAPRLLVVLRTASTTFSLSKAVSRYPRSISRTLDLR